MSKKYRYRNTGKQREIINIEGDTLTVIPNGTVVAPEGHFIERLRQFKRVGVIEEDKPEVDVEALQRQIAELQAQLESNAPAKVDAEAEVEDDVEYPVHQGGGKWLLSNGETTKGGVSREEAESLEAELQE